MNAAPHILARIAELLAAAAPDERGALWHLAEPGRELDANLVRLPPGAEVGEHQEDVLDVLLVVLAGAGSVRAGDGQVLDLAAGAVLWLPRTSRRALAAGPDGLTYLTAHRPPPPPRPRDQAAERGVRRRRGALHAGPGLPGVRAAVAGPRAGVLQPVRGAVPGAVRRGRDASVLLR